jgi:hypothetical protein
MVLNIYLKNSYVISKMKLFKENIYFHNYIDFFIFLSFIMWKNKHSIQKFIYNVLISDGIIMYNYLGKNNLLA